MGVEARAKIHTALGDETRLKIIDSLWLNDLSSVELRRMLGVDSNLMAHHLAVLEDAGLVSRGVSEGDGRRRYVTANEDLLAHYLPRPILDIGWVLFVCTHNSARSQFAEAMMNARSQIEAGSAGLHPSRTVHQKALTVASEHGIDLSRASPRSYGDVAEHPDLVVSVCDRAYEAPIPFQTRRLHWSVPDPLDDGRIRGFRSAFATISRRVDQLAAAVRQE